MIRLAHLIGALQIGGAENQVVQVASRMPPERIEVHVVAFSERNSGFKNDLQKHVRYWCMRYRKRFAPLGWWRLYRYLRTNKIDVLQCHMYHAALPGAIIGRMAGVKVILTTEHGKNTWKKRRHHLIERLIINPLVDYRVAVSEDIRQRRIALDGVSESKIGVIDNAVDTDVQQADPWAPISVIGSLGRLVDAKDFPNLIRAVKMLKARGVGLRVVIAGEGEEREALERLIRALDLGDCVDLPGMRPAADFFRSIQLFVMSSCWEGVPVSLLEAMARGLPIVATRAGGIPEVIRDGVDGLLCPIEDPEALARAIATMIENEDLRHDCAVSARRRVVERYGVDQAASRWERLYGDLLARRRGNA